MLFRHSSKLFPIIIILLFTVPNVYTIIKGKESYPFTPAPMFCHYIDEKSFFYEFEFIHEVDGLTKTVYPFHREHGEELAIYRFFFDKVYGSVERNSPLWSAKNDNKIAMEDRITNFCRVYFKYLEESGKGRIRLVVKQYDSGLEPVSAHDVGYYNLSSKRYYHTWNSKI